MKKLGTLIKLSAVALWLVAVFFAARWVENWRISNDYADL
ncbi:hypothetical protein MNBD_GAMMA02-514, partial [hydrothermal vent metagenome]